MSVFMKRAALLAAALAVAAGAPAGAAASSPPVTKVLNGGTLRYAGSITGTTDLDDHDGTTEHGSGTLTWDTSYPLASPYDNDPSPGNTYDDLPWKYSGGDVGTESSSSSVKSWIDGKYKTDAWSCKSVLTSTESPIRVGTPNDARPVGYQYMPAGVGNWKENASCGGGASHTGASFYGTNEITDNAAQPYTLPPTPHVGGAFSTDTNFAETFDCGGNCKGNYSGGGRFTLDCLLCVDSVKLEETDLKSLNRTDVPDGGTTDGNVVYVTATIRNASTKSYTSDVRFKDGATGKLIQASDYRLPPQAITWGPGETKTVQWPINTEGMAWKDGQPTPDHALQVLTAFGGGQVPFRVLPKPMILVHGWNSDASTWNTIKPQIPGLMNTGYLGRVFAVGDGQVAGKMDTNPLTGDSIDSNAKQEALYVQGVRQKLNAEHVDLVVHSMGGLISREYIQDYMPDPDPIESAPLIRYPVVTHLVMIGTPNQGSACADVILTQSPGIPTMQLTRIHAKLFNKQVTNRRGVAMSVIAGEAGVPTCIDPEIGDGVVSPTSAWFNFADTSKTVDHHLAEPQDAKIFGGWVLAHVSRSASLQSSVVGRDGAGRDPGAAAARSAVASRDARDASTATGGADPVVVLSKAVVVPAGGSLDVPLAAPTAGTPMVVESIADASVGSSLIAPGGAVASTVAAGSEDAQSPIRTNRVDAPAAGQWTLRLTGGAGQTVRLVQAVASSPLVLMPAMAQDGSGRLGVTASFTDGGKPVTGASMTAVLRDGKDPDHQIVLSDDGAHGDGKAGDGIYGGTTGALPAGPWFANVTAQRGTDLRYASAVAVQGAVNGAVSAETSVAADGGASQLGSTVGGGSKGKPSNVTAHVKTKRLRKAPYAWKVSGKLTLPAGTACKGVTLTATVAAGTPAKPAKGKQPKAAKPAKRTTLKVDKKCAFSGTVKAKKAGRYVLTVTYAGTAAIAPSTATLKVRAG